MTRSLPTPLPYSFFNQPAPQRLPSYRVTRLYQLFHRQRRPKVVAMFSVSLYYPAPVFQSDSPIGRSPSPSVYQSLIPEFPESLVPSPALPSAHLHYLGRIYYSYLLLPYPLEHPQKLAPSPLHYQMSSQAHLPSGAF